MNRLLCSVLISVSCFASGQTCAPIPGSYTLTVLPRLGGNFSLAKGINSSGAVVGWADVRTGRGTQNHPFLWTASGGMQDLGTLNGSDTYAVAINDQGTIGGYGNNGTGTIGTHPFLWTPSGGFQKLQDLTHSTFSYSYIFGMNQQAQLVGYTGDTLHTVVVAALWSGRKIDNLATISGDNSFAYANGISDNSVLVGADNESPEHALVWNQTSGLTQLPALPGTTLAAANGINRSGSVIAGSNSPGVGIEAVAWIVDTSTGQYALNDIGQGIAYAANDVCQVVGRSGTLHAFIWTPDQGAVDLNSLIPPGSGATLADAYAINDAGQIVGQTEDNAGKFSGFLLTPVQ